jgi:phosphohistidine phosphatase
MDLFVIRHAVAEDAEPGQEDAARTLTPDGKRTFRRAVQGLRELDWCFDRIITSPWTRALETAELLAPMTDGPTIVTDLLTDKPRPELFAMIAETSAAPRKRHATAVVGHAPWLSELVAWLAFGDPHHGEAIALKKGGAVWLEGSAVPGGMMLRAMLTPKLLRAMR